MKTLVLILSYNTPDLTTNLFKSLEPYKEDIYDLLVLENGSNDLNSKLQRIELKDNVYFGGGLNVAFQYVLSNSDKYDSLLFLNSDLIIHGMNFVRTLRHYSMDKQYDIISPAIINAEFNQCHWKQMLNWNSNDIRDVKWIDFQSPMFSIQYIQKQKQYPKELILGWGNDIITGINCEKWNMNIGVVDRCTVTHLNNQTVKRNEKSSNYILKNYNRFAEQNMFDYVAENLLMPKFVEFRNWGENYNY